MSRKAQLKDINTRKVYFAHFHSTVYSRIFYNKLQLFKLPTWGRYTLLHLQLRSWGTHNTQTFNPVLCFSPGCPICHTKNLFAALLGSLEMQKTFGQVPYHLEAHHHHSLPQRHPVVAHGQQWKTQNLLTRAQTNAETFISLGTIKCSPCSGLQAWFGRSHGWGSPATPSPQKHNLLPAAETGTWSEIQHCPVSSSLTLWTLCDFLGFFLKLYGLNISCCNAAYQLTSQEEFLNQYKLIIPHTHRSFLWQAWTICSLTTA